MISRNGDNLDITVRFTDGASYDKAQNLLNQSVAYFTYDSVALLMTGNLNATRAEFSEVQVTSGRMLASASAGGSEITYIDITHGASGNTHATGGSPENTAWLDSVNGSSSTNDTQWTLRENLGTNGTIYQSLHTGNQMPELTTAITGLADGDYDFTEDPRILHGVKIGRATVAQSSAVQVFVNNLTGGGSNTRTWYDGVGYSVASDGPEPPPTPGPIVLGIDFNRDDALGSPSQSRFRTVSGSATQADNATSYVKNFGSRQVTVSQPEGVAFEFRGGNGDSARAIPGGDTSLSFAFSHDGSSPLTVSLRSLAPNGIDNFLLLNGFAIYPNNP